MSEKPTHFDWMKAAREVRDGQTVPPAHDSLSAQLAAELNADAKAGGVYGGDDPINDRAEQAQRWAEEIMRSEKRERLLLQYNSSDSDWLLNRLRGILNDCLSYNRTDKPLIAHNPPIGRGKQAGNKIYAADFGLGVDLREPVFAMGGVIYGVLATAPQNAAVFTSTYSPVDYHHALKSGGVSPGWYRDDDNKLQKGTAVGVDKICDWHLAKNCENRPRFLLAFPLGNWIVFYATCNPCAGELANRI